MTLDRRIIKSVVCIQVLTDISQRLVQSCTYPILKTFLNIKKNKETQLNCFDYDNKNCPYRDK